MIYCSDLQLCSENAVILGGAEMWVCWVQLGAFSHQSSVSLFDCLFIFSSFLCVCVCVWWWWWWGVQLLYNATNVTLSKALKSLLPVRTKVHRTFDKFEQRHNTVLKTKIKEFKKIAHARTPNTCPTIDLPPLKLFAFQSFCALSDCFPRVSSALPPWEYRGPVSS